MELQFFPLNVDGYNIDKVLEGKTEFQIGSIGDGTLEISIQPHGANNNAWIAIEINKNQARYLINYLNAYIKDTNENF